MTHMTELLFLPQAISLAGQSMPLMSLCVVVKHFWHAKSMLHAAFPNAVGGIANMTHKLVDTLVQKLPGSHYVSNHASLFLTPCDHTYIWHLGQ